MPDPFLPGFVNTFVPTSTQEGEDLSDNENRPPEQRSSQNSTESGQSAGAGAFETLLDESGVEFRNKNQEDDASSRNTSVESPVIGASRLRTPSELADTAAALSVSSTETTSSPTRSNRKTACEFPSAAYRFCRGDQEHPEL